MVKMRIKIDPLYDIFEQHLYNALVEDESTDEFLSRVVGDYMGRLSSLGTVILHEHRPLIETDLRDEVLEMLRKKTYGHFNLAEFRKTKAAKSAQEEAQKVEQTKARQNRRAC